MIEYVILALPSFVAGILALALWRARRKPEPPAGIGPRLRNRAERIEAIRVRRRATRAERRG